LKDTDEGGLFISSRGSYYFWRRSPGEKQQLYVLENVEAEKAHKVAIPGDRDENAYLTKDELTMYFGSERPIPGEPNLGNFDMNVWVTQRAEIGEPWSQPQPLPAPFNEVQGAGEQWPVANASAVYSIDDSLFYVSMYRRGDSTTRLFEYRRDERNLLIDPKPVVGLYKNPKRPVGGGAMTPDGKYLFTNTYGAPGGEGGEDIYVSRRSENGEWLPAEALTSINTSEEETGAAVSPDGKTLFFIKSHLLDSATYRYSPWDIYAVPLSKLGLE